MNEAVLTLKSVCKTFVGPDGDVSALDTVNLKVTPGEFVAAMGASGSGKTTLLLVAASLLSPDSGEVEIKGEKPFALKGDARATFRARHIGLVFQQFHLIPYLSVLDNILAPSLALGKEEIRDRAHELLTTFHLKHRANHRPAELSVGEKQRTALARTLLNQPELVLADEPTGNLDSENAEIVLEHLRSFATAGGSVLLVTHDSRAAAHASRIVTMDRGKITSDETQRVVKESTA